MIKESPPPTIRRAQIKMARYSRHAAREGVAIGSIAKGFDGVLSFERALAAFLVRERQVRYIFFASQRRAYAVIFSESWVEVLSYMSFCPLVAPDSSRAKVIYV